MKQLRDKNGLTLEEFLANYNPDKYRHPSVTVDMAVFTMLHNQGACDLAVLLIRRGNHPFLGTWALPGGFVEMEEELADAAARELKEETGVTDVPLRPFGVFGAVARDPRTRVITVAFYSCLDGLPAQPKAGDDAAEAGFFTVDCTPRRENGGEWLDFVLEGCGETLRFAVRVIPAPCGFPGDVAYEPDGFRVLASDHEALLARAFAEDAKRG